MIITIANQKGGVGKSTITQTLASGLTRLYKQRVLAIDLDQQCSLTVISGFQPRSIEYTALDFINGTVEPSRLILQGADYDLVGGSADIATLAGGRDTIIKMAKALKSVIDDYDHIIIDTPPNLGPMSASALSVSGGVIVPVQADVLSVIGLAQLMETIKYIKDQINETLEILGIVITMHNPRTNIARDMKAEIQAVADQLNTRIYKHTIRDTVAVREAQVAQVSIWEYAPKANIVNDYRGLLREITTQLEKVGNDD